MSNIEARYLNEGTKLHNERYIIGRTIGAGGFGVTYAAWDTTLQTRVAIKEYLPGEFSTRAPGTITVSIYGGEKEEQYKDGLKKFYDESRHLAQFQGIPGIVQVFDVFMENDTAYIVMEYLEGETLGERLKREERIPYQEAVKIMLPILQALKAVHKEGILHRDIAPNNIFLCKNGEVKLLDFGAARSATGTHSKSLTVLYKEGYTAEEQYRSRGDQGAWTDVYACAATLYKMITGNIPQGAMERRRKDMLKAPSKCGIKLPMNVERAIMNALNIDIKDRTQTAGLFMDELLSSKGVNNRFKKVKNKKRDRIPFWIWGISSVANICVTVFMYMVIDGSFAFVDGFANLFVEEGKVRVVNVINMPEEEAFNRLSSVGLIFEIEDYKYSNKVEEGRIISQNIKKGEIVETGSVIQVIVSKGAGIVSVPNMVGKKWESIQTELEELCLEYELHEVESDDASGYVFQQGIEPGTVLEQGSIIDISVSKGRVFGENDIYMMENLVGQSYFETKTRLADKGIYLQIAEYQYDDNIAKGKIISQSISEGTLLEENNIQEVIVSEGLDPKKITAFMKKAYDYMLAEDYTAMMDYYVSEEMFFFLERMDKNEYIYIPEDNSLNGIGVGLYRNELEGFPSIYIYYGNYYNGKREGVGRVFYGTRNEAVGDSYLTDYRFIGEWKDDSPNGYGELSFTTNDDTQIIKGTLHNGLWDGKIQETFTTDGMLFDLSFTADKGIPIDDKTVEGGFTVGKDQYVFAYDRVGGYTVCSFMKRTDKVGVCFWGLNVYQGFSWVE